MFSHDYLLACEISTVRTQTLRDTPDNLYISNVVGEF